jgi:tRNA(Ile)-lysidine synthase
LRNYLRHEVLPLIARRFPSYRATVARSARHVAEAVEVLDEVAAKDGAGSLRNGTLAVAGLRRLSLARARNLLRYFLAQHGVAMPATGRLHEALRQVLNAKQDARVAIELDGASLRRYEGRLQVVPTLEPPRWHNRGWRGEQRLELPGLGGALIFTREKGKGISLARLRGGKVTIRLRRGGERLRPDCRRPTRSLKNLLQEARVAPWLRERLPLLCCGEDLVWVPGVGVDAGYQAGRGEPGLHPEWAPAV